MMPLLSAIVLLRLGRKTSRHTSLELCIGVGICRCRCPCICECILECILVCVCVCLCVYALCISPMYPKICTHTHTHIDTRTRLHTSAGYVKDAADPQRPSACHQASMN